MVEGDVKEYEQFMIIKINLQLCIHCLPNDLQDVIIAKARINNVHQCSISFSIIYVVRENSATSSFALVMNV